MSTQTINKQGRGTFARGVHPAGHKILAAGAAIEALPTPDTLSIPLMQNAGAPCEPVVKARDVVEANALLGSSDAFISAPVHAPLPGTVGREGVTTLPNGRHVAALPIKVDGEFPEGGDLVNEIYGGNWTTSGLERFEPEAIVQAVKDAGIVGQGGAAFPTYVKLKANPEKPVETILLNGCECEPYLTADHRLMIEFPSPIISGALLAARAAGAQNVVVAIEDNKPEAIRAMKKAVSGTSVQIMPLKTKYPMGGEKQTVLAALGREIPTGGLPLDVGVVVINVATSAALARAVLRNKPLTHRVVSVTGPGIVRPSNLLVPVGVTYRALIDYCGGLTSKAARVISGGPMMGFSMGSLDAPVTKGTSGIVVLTEDEVARAQETACVRCGRCVDVCPLHLVPTRLALASRNKNWDLAKKYHLRACMECGCCAYVCPASIPLVQLMRMGKAEMPRD